MKPGGLFLKIVILILVSFIVAFNVLIYQYCEKQKAVTETLRNQQQLEAQDNGNKFKFQQEQIERLNKDLVAAQQQLKEQKESLADQKDALVQEAEKRQQLENGNKSIQTSLADIQAEADAIKESMKGWQKDYVGVLAEFEKKMDDSQNQIKTVEDNLVALNIPELKENIKSLKSDLEKITQPPDNSSANVLPAQDNKAGNPPSQLKQ